MTTSSETQVPAICAEVPKPEAPEPDPVLEAFRTELLNYMKEPLTAKSLRQILQIASAARELLAVRNPKNRYRGQRRGGTFTYGNSGGYVMNNPAYTDEYEDEDEEGVGMQMSPGHMNVDRETFGARILREIVAVIPQVLRASREDQAQIVQAVAAAEKLGMTDLAESLKARLLPDVPGTPASECPASPTAEREASVWGARLPGSSQYVAGPAPYKVVEELATPDCEIVNTETGVVHRPAHPNPTGTIGLQGEAIP